MVKYTIPILPGPLARRLTTTGEDGACWIWTGQINKGYGRVLWEGRLQPVHRVVYKLRVGALPDGQPLDHLCRNRACANPDHLEPVSHRENILRGAGITAQQARATVCKNGHPFDVVRADGRRGCLECDRKKARDYYYRHPDKMAAKVKRRTLEGRHG